MAMIDGTTPIDPEEAQALIPELSTQEELNEFEFLNILEASRWTQRSRKIRQSILDIETLRLLHYRMFDKTWRWAGQYRKTQKSIGVESYRIMSELKRLMDDALAWIELNSYEPIEIAARFHHRLVWIHAYPNGNGRHARMATDLLIRNQGWPPIAWGQDSLVNVSETRSAYIAALRAADTHDFRPLLQFMSD